MFIINSCRLNQKLARKPYLSPRIGENMQQLEGFQYETALDLNMGYYTISISPARQKTTSIVTEFRKFRYNSLPMVICASGDIFQAKVEKLLGDTEGVKTYIGDIIVLSKDCFRKHTEHLITIFGRLSAEALTVNDNTCSFG